MRTFMYATPILIIEVLSCYSSKAIFIDCYSELTLYIVLANCYGISAYNAYQFKGPRPLPYNSLQLLYNNCRNCLTNRMGSISRHITPLVFNSLGDGRMHTHTNTHTHTHTHTHIHTHTYTHNTHTHIHTHKHTHTYRHLHRNNFKKPGIHLV